MNVNDPIVADVVTGVILTLITAVATVVTRAVVRLAPLADYWLRARIDGAVVDQLEAIAAQAVHAAEQGAIAGRIADKKAEAEAVVNHYAVEFGLPVTAEQIDAAIEAAVSREFNPPHSRAAVTVDATSAA